MLGSISLTDADPYMNPRLKEDESPVTGIFSIQPRPAIDELPAFDKSKFLYHVNKVTGVYWLCIPRLVAADILAITQKED